MAKKFKKLMKIVNIDKENVHSLRTTWGISMKFSGKMCLMIILKVTKCQGFTLSVENAGLKKNTAGVRGQNNPPAFSGLINSYISQDEISLVNYVLTLTNQVFLEGPFSRAPSPPPSPVVNPKPVKP